MGISDQKRLVETLLNLTRSNAEVFSIFAASNKKNAGVYKKAAEGLKKIESELDNYREKIDSGSVREKDIMVLGETCKLAARDLEGINRGLAEAYRRLPERMTVGVEVKHKPQKI